MRPSQRRPVFAAVPGRPDLKRFIGFEGDPGTVPRRFDPRTQRGLGALGSDRDRGEFPLPDGTPGAPFYPNYDERFIWGDRQSDQVIAPVDPSTPVPPVPGPQLFDTGISIPFGVSIVRWKNPTTFQTVPILASTPQNTPVLSLNMERNGLVIQNNSTATAPDVAPVFYIGFNAQPQIGLAMAVAPGVGILLDIICPRDSIYLIFGPSVNGGGTVVIQGAVVQGTYAPV
jgi:hypothetical protein